MFQFTVHEYPLFIPDNNNFYEVNRWIFILKGKSIKEAYKRLLEILNRRTEIEVRESVVNEGTYYSCREVYKIVDFTPLILIFEDEINKEYIKIYAGCFRKKKKSDPLNIHLAESIRVSKFVQDIIDQAEVQ